MIFRNGSIFEGLFKDGVKNGRGHYKWPDGSEYIGTWKNNLSDG